KRYSTWDAAGCGKHHEREGENTLRATPVGSSVERKRWLKKLPTRAPFRPSLRFLYHYVWKQGFRDGYRVWMPCRLLAWYGRTIVLKKREMMARSRVISDSTSRQ